MLSFSRRFDDALPKVAGQEFQVHSTTVQGPDDLLVTKEPQD
jgi:hypothetical protein